MIFLGDLACPKERVDALNECVSALDLFSNELIIINFEAVVKLNGTTESDTLYNAPDAIKALKTKAKKIIVSLANNHMYDYPDDILPTKSYLEDNGIGVFGLKEEDGSIKPYEYTDDNDTYAFFGHCWSLYSATHPNKTNNVEIVDIDYGDFLNVVASYIKLHPQTKVYCFMHWNYDLEKYPFPMHVKLSHDLIDAGVEGVIGSHSHIVQGIELYKGHPIAYCLGNFYLPSGIFFNGKLIYPAPSKETIGVRLKNKKIDLIHFETDRESCFRVKNIEDYKSNISTKKPEQYLDFFKKKRVKRIFVPVFVKYTGISYNIKLIFAISRIKIIKHILKLLPK